jgi:hypothetical protein
MVEARDEGNKGTFECTARYRPLGGNPFAEKSKIQRITADIPIGTTDQEVRRLAYEAAPEGYELIGFNLPDKRAREF